MLGIDYFIEYSLAYYLGLFSLFGVIYFIYLFVITAILEFFVRNNVFKIKNTINRQYPGTYDVLGEHFLKFKGFIYGYGGAASGGVLMGKRIDSFQLGISSSFKKWTVIKRKVFRQIDVEEDKNFNFSKEVAILKRSYFINKITVIVLAIFYLMIFIAIIYSAVTGHHFFNF